MSFTPEQITEILQIYFDNFVSQTYTGMRYVPIIGRRGESSAAWDNTAPYEPLTIVTYSNESYTSRQYVPAGVAITNTDYWVKTGAYNAQIAELQDALPIAQFDSENTVKDYIDELGSFLPASDFDNDNTVKAYIDEIADLLPSSAFDNVNTVRGALNGRVRAFETVADMAAATDLVADMICHTNGFYTSGDGGAAFYEIKSTGTANAMDIIACQDSLKAHLIVDNEIRLEQLGAQKNVSFDCEPYYNRACTLIDKGKIQLLSGNYYFSHLTLNYGISVNGLSREATYIYAMQSNNASFIDIAPDIVAGIKISNITIIGNENNTNQIGININASLSVDGTTGGFWYSLLECITLKQFTGYGIYCEATDIGAYDLANMFLTFINVESHKNGKESLYIKEQMGQLVCINSRFADPANTYYCIHVENSHTQFYGCTIEFADKGVYIDGGETLFNGCWFEEVKGLFNINRSTSGFQTRVIVDGGNISNCGIDSGNGYIINNDTGTRCFIDISNIQIKGNPDTFEIQPTTTKRIGVTLNNVDYTNAIQASNRTLETSVTLDNGSMEIIFPDTVYNIYGGTSVTNIIMHCDKAMCRFMEGNGTITYGATGTRKTTSLNQYDYALLIRVGISPRMIAVIPI